MTLYQQFERSGLVKDPDTEMTLGATYFDREIDSNFESIYEELTFTPQTYNYHCHETNILKTSSELRNPHHDTTFLSIAHSYATLRHMEIHQENPHNTPEEARDIFTKELERIHKLSNHPAFRAFADKLFNKMHHDSRSGKIEGLQVSMTKNVTQDEFAMGMLYILVQEISFTNKVRPEETNAEYATLAATIRESDEQGDQALQELMAKTFVNVSKDPTNPLFSTAEHPDLTLARICAKAFESTNNDVFHSNVIVALDTIHSENPTSSFISDVSELETSEKQIGTAIQLVNDETDNVPETRKAWYDQEAPRFVKKLLIAGTYLAGWYSWRMARRINRRIIDNLPYAPVASSILRGAEQFTFNYSTLLLLIRQASNQRAKINNANSLKEVFWEGTFIPGVAALSAVSDAISRKMSQ